MNSEFFIKKFSFLFSKEINKNSILFYSRIMIIKIVGFVK